MTVAISAIVLALFWAALTGSFTGPNLLLGAALALVAFWLLRGDGQATRLRRSWAIAALAGMFAWELLLSAVRVARVVLSPRLTVRPAIVAVPLTLKSDVQITLLANMITLTPGTLSIDVSDDKSVLYVHVLVLTDRQTLIAEIATGFENQIRTVFA